MRLKQCTSLILFIISFLFSTAYSQEHKTLIEQKKYNEALINIQRQINEIYSKRSLDKHIPLSYIAIEKIEEGVDLKKLFIERKMQPFFIEDNTTLYSLHYDAAICYQNLYKYNEAIQHFFQALRFTTISEKDNVIFYSLAQLFKKIKKYDAYLMYLEEAYEINPNNYDYSLELALELANGKNKKKALYHLNRYIQAKANEINPQLYLTAANCYESIGDYINAAQCYLQYLSRQPDDAAILFALGYLAFTKISDMKTAYLSLTKGLGLYKDTDVIRKGLSHAMLGDIAYMDLNYRDALNHYLQSVSIADTVQDNINQTKATINENKRRINEIKSTLLEKKDVSLYPEYQTIMDELGNNELSLRQLEHEYSKFNIGELYFKIASVYEITEKYSEAIDWYTKTIALGTRIRESSKKIEKLQLKISRGY